MSQENIQTDTPQQNTEPQYETLEEAVFGDVGDSNNVESAFTTEETSNEGNQAAPVQGQPAQTQATEPVQEQSNDEKRFQYWQSQHDKVKNENSKLRGMVAQNAQAPQAPVQEAPYQEPVEEFPPAPEKPQRPRAFSREEAYSDPASESARYLDSMEDWRDNISEYNTIKTQYDSAVIQDKFDKMEHEKVQNAQRFQARQRASAQANQIREHVMGHYGMNETQAQDFMSKMSNPESLNIDNLVQLYRLQEGGAPQQGTPAQPSSTFKQVQNAQQVPSPMGVMPSGQANNDGTSVEDKIMDTMVGNFNSKNPWK